MVIKHFKHYPAFSQYLLAKPMTAALVLLLSLWIMPLYTEGDQRFYRMVYDALPDLSLAEGFRFYSQNLGSQEFTHFLLSWTVSRFLGQDLFIAFSNAILAYIVMSVFQKWKASVIIALLIVLTNFYFLVLYFAAERLKFGVMFLALSMLYIDQLRLGRSTLLRFVGFSWLAIISHAQVLLVYAAIAFNFFTRQILKLAHTGKVSKFMLYAPIPLFIALLFVGEHLSTKLQINLAKMHYYYDGSIMVHVAEILVFFLLALWYSKNKSEVFLLFVPIVFAVLLVGGDRVNLFGYFAVLYYGLQVKGGWNLGVLGTSAYFSYRSIDFLANIFQYGHGFPVE